MLAGGRGPAGRPRRSASSCPAPRRQRTSAPALDHERLRRRRREHARPVAARDRPLVYVPNSQSNTVDVIDPRTSDRRALRTSARCPQHVVPSWDLKTLYVLNDAGNSLTPIDPRTGKPGRHDPGRRSVQHVLHARRPLRDRRRRAAPAPRLPRRRTRSSSSIRCTVPCRGVDHMDFSADGRYLIATCEFSGQLVKVDVAAQRARRRADAAGRRDAAGREALARRQRLLRRRHGARRRLEGRRRPFSVLGFIRTGAGAHGLYPSRDARFLYVDQPRRGVDLGDQLRDAAAWSRSGASPAAAAPTWAASPPTARCSG